MNDIPLWAKWIRDEKGYPSCCYTCKNYIDGVCTEWKAEPPKEWKEEPGHCESWTLDEIPF